MKNRNNVIVGSIVLIAWMNMVLPTLLSAHTGDSLSVTKLKKYERTKLRAANYYDDYAYAKGILVYKKVLNILPSDDTVKLDIAKGYFLVNDLDSATIWYDRVFANNIQGISSEHYLNYAEVLTSKGRYIEAREWYLKFEELHPNDRRVKDRLIGLDQIFEFYKDSVRFEIWHAAFNSTTYDFSPSYFEDQVLFVSARETTKGIQFLKPKYKWDKTYFLNLFKVDSANHAHIFNRKIKSSYHEGPVAFYNGDTRVIFTRNNYTKGELRFNKKKLHVQGAKAEESKEGINKLKLFFSEKEENGSWTTPDELWFNSNEYSTGHPTVSKDGKRLYFASDREGGLGKTDIYRSIWYEDVWGEPENLGNIINSEGNEMFPFVDENEILYYASDGHKGLGGLDIFKVDLKKIGDQPVNMGYPINSSTDDFGVIIKDEGVKQTGYFASNRIGGLGLDDIYGFSFEKRRAIPGKVVDLLTGVPLDSVNIAALNQNGDTTSQVLTMQNGLFNFPYDWESSYTATAIKSAYTKDKLTFTPSDIPAGDTIILRITKELLIIRGTITDEIKGDTLDAARIIVKNETTGDQFGMKTREDGAYSFIGQPNTSYSYTVKKHRFFTKNSQLNTKSQHTGEIIHDIQLEEIVIGKPIELDDIHFDLAKWNIRPDAAEELDKFTGLLDENPSIIVELSTHTDCRGSDPYNLNLSDKRAKSSAEYVIQHGISKQRLAGKGYGETKLLNKCDDGVKCSEDEHQINRRAEFMVTGFLPAVESEEEKALLWISPDYISANMSQNAKEKVVFVDHGESGTVTLSGTVTDESGNAMGNTLISVMEKGKRNATQVKTDQQGNFEFKAQPNKTYRIVAQKQGYLEEGLEVKVQSSAVSDLNLELAKTD
ncbi:MAG: carboxypeptidase regulatory-like domain-containing protein [Reichenbachiella sp.]|uniref:carboxypeptidase regulatory-like domain-containing protein n=1 Tax=Reichenbachiella sp. TaxID=2184521 RepID=UPI0032672269